jgi:hypothetical protein
MLWRLSTKESLMNALQKHTKKSGIECRIVVSTILSPSIDNLEQRHRATIQIRRSQEEESKYDQVSIVAALSFSVRFTTTRHR